MNRDAAPNSAKAEAIPLIWKCLPDQGINLLVLPPASL